MEDIVIVSAARTAVGKFGGSLAKTPATELGAAVLKAILERSGLSAVDAVYLTGGSSALRPLVEALHTAMPGATLVEGNRFGGVAAGLAVAGATQAA